MRVIGYIRVSTDRQDLGPAAQRDALQAWADSKGCTLTFVEDVCSGGTPLAERVGGAYLLGLLARGQAEALAVAKLDRLARSTRDFASTLELAKQQGWSVIALDLGVDTGTPQGEMVATVMMAMAQYERELIRARTKDGLAVARPRGKQVGGPSVPGKVARRIKRQRDAGDSYSRIARALNEDGVPTARGGKWHPSTIRYIYENR
jgi:DNA invertase Pin-like site-specific DNA recombinase